MHWLTHSRAVYVWTVHYPGLLRYAYKGRQAYYSWRWALHAWRGREWCLRQAFGVFILILRFTNVLNNNNNNNCDCGVVWPWPLTYWPPALIVDHLWQLAAKLLHTFSKYHVHKFSNWRTNGQWRCSHNCYRMLIGICSQAFEWCYFQWPWVILSD